jgi:DNA repair exonuclease SbcCD ATPase subunit
VSEISSTKNNISNNNSKTYHLERKVSLSESLTHKFKVFFGGEKIDTESLRAEIRGLKSENEKLEKRISSLRTQIISLYDFWPETPPDWQKRKHLVQQSSGGSCQRCGTSHIEKHIHHRIPVSRGGSHKIENLEQLCVKCHSQAHHGRNVSTKNKEINAVNRPVFSDRLEQIKYAIENKLIISFNYQKYYGDKSRRSINPEYLEQKGKSLCVAGYCHLRKADRIFAIKRMTGVKIVETPGKSYDK